jgi:hypothetical protein
MIDPISSVLDIPFIEIDEPAYKRQGNEGKNQEPGDLTL